MRSNKTHLPAAIAVAGALVASFGAVSSSALWNDKDSSTFGVSIPSVETYGDFDGRPMQNFRTSTPYRKVPEGVVINDGSSFMTPLWDKSTNKKDIEELASTRQLHRVLTYTTKSRGEVGSESLSGVKGLRVGAPMGSVNATNIYSRYEGDIYGPILYYSTQYLYRVDNPADCNSANDVGDTKYNKYTYLPDVNTRYGQVPATNVTNIQMPDWNRGNNSERTVYVCHSVILPDTYGPHGEHKNTVSISADSDTTGQRVEDEDSLTTHVDRKTADWTTLVDDQLKFFEQQDDYRFGKIIMTDYYSDMEKVETVDVP